MLNEYKTGMAYKTVMTKNREDYCNKRKKLDLKLKFIYESC